MQPHEWQRIKEVLSAALDRPPGERAAFLDAACGGDPALRAEVDSLLAAHEEPENLLEQHSIDLQARLQSGGADYAGQRFGPWRILREIGRGGMGAVFLAERADGAFEQQVALKIIRHGVVGGELERHFLRERQILASLNHPNIAKLVDGGVSEAGELFLAMEFIAGEPLLEFAEHSGLTIDQRLRIFVKVCAAVSFAHQRLIIHRDLKPSNIMVAADGEPRLLDFGLAKLAEPLSPEGAPPGGDVTQTAFRAFTPAYAAPEQILGRTVTTASDVFSLGVILYELLTREKPFHFEGKALEDIIRTVTTGEPSAPSRAVRSGGPHEATRRRQLKGDLDNITLKALQKDPARRYQSVADLAADIERHFEHLPITARPNTLSYRASRFYHRNRLAVAAAGVVVLAVLAGAALALGQYRNARRESAKADVVNAFLQSVLVSGNPGAGRGFQTTITDIWRDAEARLDSGEMANQPEVRAELRFLVGNGYVNQGNYVAGEKNLRRAVAEQTRLYGAESPTVLKTELALAELFFATANYDSAEQIYGPKVGRLRSEYRKGTIEPDFIARVLSDYGVMQRARGNAGEAETLLRESLAILDEHQVPGQANFNGGMLTLILIDRGKFDEAEQLERASVAALRARVGNETPEFCAALTLLGIILMEKGDLAGADANLREAEAIYHKLYDPNFIAIYDNLRLQAQVAYLAGRYPDAMAKIDRVLENYRRNSNPKYISYATALTVQGLILNRLGKSAEAEQVLRQALKLRTENLPATHFMAALTRGALGECLTARQRYAEAETLLLDSFRSLESSQGVANPRTLLAVQRLVTLYEKWGRPHEADTWRQRIAPART